MITGGKVNHVRGVADFNFFLGLIVFMGGSLTCVNALLKKQEQYFSHNLPLFCPYSYKRADNFLLL